MRHFYAVGNVEKGVAASSGGICTRIWGPCMQHGLYMCTTARRFAHLPAVKRKKCHYPGALHRSAAWHVPRDASRIVFEGVMVVCQAVRVHCRLCGSDGKLV